MSRNMSIDEDVAEAEANFKGPGPILRPTRQPPPPPPPTDIQRQQSSLEEEEENSSPTPSSADVETPPVRSTLLSEFTDLFNNFDYAAVRKRIIDRRLNECSFTTILWRIFLHCLPIDSTKWSRALEESRASYDELAQRFVIEPHKLSHKTKIDQNDDHPLSQSDDSLWSQYHQNNELRDNLEQDVRRTYPEYPFFHQAHIQQLLIKILFVHSLKYEKKLPYRQGMHEILAVVVFCMYSEALRVNENPESNELMKTIYDLQYLEHDAFSTYEVIMEHLKQFYDVKGENAATKKFVSTCKVKDYVVQAMDTAGRVNNIVKRLHEFDEPLDEKLRSIDIDPSIYGIRWLRLLFGREISFESIPSLWTLIFSYDDNFGFVDFFFLALLIERGRFLGDKRSSLCFSTSLQALLPNDVVLDAEDLILKALAMAEQSSTSPSPIAHHPVSTESNPFDSARDNGARAKESSRFASAATRFITNDISKPISSPPTKSKIVPEVELEQCPGTETEALLKECIEMQTILADYTDKLVHKLDRDLKKNSIDDDLAFRDPINGLEHIIDALKGRTTFDEEKLLNALGSCDEETVHS